MIELPLHGYETVTLAGSGGTVPLALTRSPWHPELDEHVAPLIDIVMQGVVMFEVQEGVEADRPRPGAALLIALTVSV